MQEVNRKDRFGKLDVNDGTVPTKDTMKKTSQNSHLPAKGTNGHSYACMEF